MNGFVGKWCNQYTTHVTKIDYDTVCDDMCVFKMAGYTSSVRLLDQYHQSGLQECQSRGWYTEPQHEPWLRGFHLPLWECLQQGRKKKYCHTSQHDPLLQNLPSLLTRYIQYVLSAPVRRSTYTWTACAVGVCEREYYMLTSLIFHTSQALPE